uniref:mucin-5AC-like isoform X1 n=1 Tax=Ciona intestinalis TaxID=7719 RepID=UPI000180CC9E|nr:mucin-5AC-like isoform X1 [Ciona intestinalis]|eukprot:XP_026691354.1 mucin-5AC-like isoform X1 [Ciona intestinalis]
MMSIEVAASAKLKQDICVKMAVGSKIETLPTVPVPCQQSPACNKHRGFGLPYQDHNYGALPPPPTPPLSPTTGFTANSLNGENCFLSSPSKDLCIKPTPIEISPPHSLTSNLPCYNGAGLDKLNEDRVVNSTTAFSNGLAAAGSENSTVLSDITRCICGFTHDDGYMICCDQCSVWQHIDCMSIDRNNIPETFLCDHCNPRSLNREEAIKLQTRKREDFLMGTDSSGTDSDVEMNNKVLYSSVQSTPTSLTITSKKQEAVSTGKKRKRSRENSKRNGKKNHFPSRKRSRSKSSCNETEECGISFSWARKLREWNEKYQEINENMYSQELLQAVLSSSSKMAVKEQSNLSKLREQLVKVQQLRNTVLTLEDVCMSHPVAEVCGSYMLSNQFEGVNSTLYERPYPFVFFYNGFDGLEICVDSRTTGNISRYIRRSCCPNCEIRHVMEDGKIHLFIYAKSRILNGAEITIPFDIKYQNCHYNMECGCSQFKDCPVYKFTNMRIPNDSKLLKLDERKRRLSPLRLSLNRIHTNGYLSSDHEATRNIDADGDNAADNLRKKSREERKMEAYIRRFEKMEKQEKRKEQLHHAHPASDISKESSKQEANDFISTSTVTSTSDSLQAVVMSHPCLPGEENVSTHSPTPTRRIGNNRRRSTRGRRNSRRGRGVSFEGVMSPGAAMETDSNHSCDSVTPHCTISSFSDRFPSFDSENSSSFGVPHYEALPETALIDTITSTSGVNTTSTSPKSITHVTSTSTIQQPNLTTEAGAPIPTNVLPNTSLSPNDNTSGQKLTNLVSSPTQDAEVPSSVSTPLSPSVTISHSEPSTAAVSNNITVTTTAITPSDMSTTTTTTTATLAVNLSTKLSKSKKSSVDIPSTSTTAAVFSRRGIYPTSTTQSTTTFVPWTFRPGVPLGQVHISVCPQLARKSSIMDMKFTKKYWLQRAVEEDLIPNTPVEPAQPFIAADKISLTKETHCPKKRYLKSALPDTVQTSQDKLYTNIESDAVLTHKEVKCSDEQTNPTQNLTVDTNCGLPLSVPGNSETSQMLCGVTPVEVATVNINANKRMSPLPSIEYESLSDDDDETVVLQSEPEPSTTDEQEVKSHQPASLFPCINTGYTGATTTHRFFPSMLDNTTSVLSDPRSQLTLDQQEVKSAPTKKKVSLQEYLKRSKDGRKSLTMPTELHKPVKPTSSSPAILSLSPVKDSNQKPKEQVQVSKLSQKPTPLQSPTSTDKPNPGSATKSKSLIKTTNTHVEESVEKLTKALNEVTQGNLASALQAGLIKTLPPKVMDVVVKAVKTLNAPSDVPSKPLATKSSKQEHMAVKEDSVKHDKSVISPALTSPSHTSTTSEHRSIVGRCHSSPAIRGSQVKSKPSSLSTRSPAHRNSFPTPGKSRASPASIKSFASPQSSRSYSSTSLTSPSTPTFDHRHSSREASSSRDNLPDTINSRSRHNSGTSSGSNSTMSSKSPRHHPQESGSKHSASNNHKQESSRHWDSNNNNPPQKVPSITPAVPGQPIPSLVRGPNRVPQVVYNRRSSPVLSRDGGSPRWDGYSPRESTRPPKDIRYPPIEYYPNHPPLSPCESDYQYRRSSEKPRHYDGRYRPPRRDEVRGDSRMERPPYSRSHSSYYPSHYHDPPLRSDKGAYYPPRIERSLSPGPPRHGPMEYYSKQPNDRPGGYYSHEPHRR